MRMSSRRSESGLVTGRRVAAAASVLVAMLLGLQWWQIQRLSAPPPCADYSGQYQTALDEISDGKTAVALDRLSIALSAEPDGPACPEDRQRLARLWYETSVDETFRTRAATWYDAAQQHAEMRHWQAVSDTAAAHGVPDAAQLDAEDVFVKAHEYELFDTADWAYRGMPIDSQERLVRRRVAFLTDWGSALDDSPVIADRELALVVWRTAVALGDAYRVDTDEVCRRLMQERFTEGDCRSLPADPTEPLLTEDHVAGL